MSDFIQTDMDIDLEFEVLWASSSGQPDLFPDNPCRGSPPPYIPTALAGLEKRRRHEAPQVFAASSGPLNLSGILALERSYTPPLPMEIDQTEVTLTPRCVVAPSPPD